MRLCSESIKKTLDMGAVDYIEKPVDIKELLNKIDEASHKRILLIQKQAKEDIKDILKRKAW